MQRHDWSSTSPKEPMLHLSLSAWTWCELQQVASARHWCLHIDQPQAQHYFYSLLRIYIPSRSLRSASERRLVVPSQRGSKSLSRKFSFTVPVWWNDLPTPIRNADSLTIFKRWLKTHLFHHYLKKKKLSLFLIFPCLACTFLNNEIWFWALSLSVYLFEMNCLMYSPIVSHFG